jgi:hypothetical protein
MEIVDRKRSYLKGVWKCFFGRVFLDLKQTIEGISKHTALLLAEKYLDNLQVA